MSSPDREKQGDALARFISHCKKHDRAFIIIDEILPLLYQLPMERLGIFKKWAWREVRRQKAKEKQAQRRQVG